MRVLGLTNHPPPPRSLASLLAQAAAMVQPKGGGRGTWYSDILSPNYTVFGVIRPPSSALWGPLVIRRTSR
jgi:hypothetical protein